MSWFREDPARHMAWEELLQRKQVHHRRRRRRHRRRRKNAAPAAVAAAPPAVPPPPPNPRAPMWVPSGADLEAVPEEVRQMIPRVIEPAYEQFVLRAADGLERWIGNTLVHLLWLESLHRST